MQIRKATASVDAVFFKKGKEDGLECGPLCDISPPLQPNQPTSLRTPPRPIRSDPDQRIEFIRSIYGKNNQE